MTTTTPAVRKPVAPTTNVTYIVGAWAVLMAMTLLTWWLGADHGLASFGVKGIDAVILIVTFGKIFIVGHAFMEHRHAARWLRFSFAAWCAVTCGALVALYVT